MNTDCLYLVFRKAMIDLPKASNLFVFYEAMVNNNYENKYQSYNMVLILLER